MSDNGPVPDLFRWRPRWLGIPFSLDAQLGYSAMPRPSSVETSLTYPAVADATLGRYRLFAKLGSGGQADVFLAIARGTLGLDKLVVIKRARARTELASAEQLGIFVDEARLTLRLNPPNLVHTYEVGEAQGAHFISMEHVEG